MIHIKYFVVILLASLFVFTLGRYSAQNPEVKTTVDTTKDVKKDLNENIQTHEVSISEKDPDGTTKTTTTKDTTTVKKVDTITDTTTKITQDVIPPKTNTVSVSILAGYDITRQGPVYGASLTKQVLGPITIGAFGLSNGTVGGSIGLQF